MRASYIALALLLISTSAAYAQPPEAGAVRSELLRAYSEVVSAEAEGANVTGLVADLNRALQLIREAEATGGPEGEAKLAEAAAIVREVRGAIPGLVEEARACRERRLILTGIGLASLIVGGVLIYVYAPRLVWNAWLKARREWKVRRIR